MDRSRYASNLTNDQWSIVEPLLPAQKRFGRMTTGQLSGCDRRDILPAAHWLPVAATAERVSGLEHGLLVFSVVAAHRRLGPAPTRALQADTHPFRPCGMPERRDQGWAIGEDHRVGGTRGFDAFKRVKGRKRHILVDTLGLPIANRVEAADVSDRRAGALLTSGLQAIFPAITTVM